MTVYKLLHECILQCVLVESGLKDSWTLQMNSEGKLIGFSMRAHALQCSNRDVDFDDLTSFGTSVEIAQPATGPT